jgi:hypothetical protein
MYPASGGVLTMKEVDLQHQWPRNIGATLLMVAVLLLVGCSKLKSPTGTIEILQVSSPTIPPVIESISPTSGTFGTEVVIRGSGFTRENNDVAFTHERINFQGSHTAYVSGLASPEGRTLRFTLPEILGACAFSQMGPGAACPMVGIELPAGPSTVTVLNRNGISNTVIFERRKSERERAEEIIYNSPAYQKLKEILEEVARSTGGEVGVEIRDCNGRICIIVWIEEDVPELSRQIPSQIEGFEVKVEPWPEEPPAGEILREFDTNRNELIDDLEFFAILEAWIATRISDDVFFYAIDLWLNETLLS